MDPDRYQKEINYYKKQIDALSGENISLDYTILGLRHDLKQKREGFALLSELQQSIGAHQQISSIFEITIRTINTTLGMEKTVILTPSHEENIYKPSQWLGFREDFVESFSSLTLEFPSDFGTQGLLLVNQAAEKTPLIENIQRAFDLPFFVCVPVAVKGTPIGLLLSGVMKEAMPLYPPLDRGIVDTFQAIAGLISASVQNMRVAVLEETDRQKTQFFANISHEFRTPITLTLGPLEQMLSGQYGTLPDALRNQMLVMLRNQERLLSLINQILDLAKFEAGQMQLKASQTVNLNQFIQQRIDPFRLMAEKKQINLKFSSDPEVDSADLYIDREKFDKLLVNLLSNSLKFTKQGSIYVSTEIHNENFFLTVTDTGIGIQEDQLPYIFDRFRQADGSVSREYAGTGIGLSLVKEVSDLHGGDVTVRSEYGKGTSFRVAIPLGTAHLPSGAIVEFIEESVSNAGFQDQQRVEGKSDPKAVEDLNQSMENSYENAKQTILYAEDNPELRTYVKELLIPHFNVYLAVDGQDGLEKIRRYHPDLVLADFMMPRMSGRELLDAVRMDPDLNRIPVILLTARAGSEARIECLNAGADDYITKPFDVAELLARTRNLLRSFEQERQLAELNKRLKGRVEEQMAELVRTGELKRFLPATVAESILSGQIGPLEHFERRKVTVLFVSITGFSELSNRLEPEELSSFLNEYLREMTAISVSHGGTVDRFVGDTVMVLFGAPQKKDVDQQASAAIATAFAMRRKVIELAAAWRRCGASSKELDVRIGINTGYCTAGVYGSDLLQSYTVVGPPVNVAYGLQSGSRSPGILLGLTTYALVEDRVRAVLRGALSLPGISGTVDAYEITEQEPAVAVSSESPKQLDGQTVSHYRIQGKLGAGGMGEVYLGQDTKLDRLVALKILPADFATDPDRKRRFLLEAKATSGLSHPNICIIHEFGETEDGRPYIAMEHIQGETLETFIRDSPLALSKIIDFAIQIADALEEAHSKRIIHRDIKTQNIMITQRGQVKVLDFGLAKIKQDTSGPGSRIHTQTQSGVVMGTPDFMSPEQALGQVVDHRTDIFSVGVVLYYAATGRRPFSGNNFGEVMNCIINVQPEAMARFNYNLPSEMERIVRKCLEKDRDRRYQSMSDLLIDLRNLKRDTESAAHKQQ